MGGNSEPELEAGKRAAIKIPNPVLPSKADVEEHELTHLPYRSWCAHCVRAKGRAADHKKQEERHREVREFHMDYCFMGTKAVKDSLNPKLNAILAVKEKETKMIMGTFVPKKGATHEFVAKRVVAFIDELGMSNCKITIKTDQEPAIIDLVNNIKRLRPGVETMHEHSPVGSSASNGVIERGIQTLEGQIRVIKDALETRWKVKIGEEQKVLSWLVEYAAVLVNRYEVGHDGKTPYERARGKSSRMLGVEFGERLLFRRQPIGARLAKLESLWEEGVFLGYRSQSGEYMIGTAEGAFRTRTIKRTVLEQRWKAENINCVVGTTWKPMAGEEHADDVMPAVQINMKDDTIEIERPQHREEHVVPRRVYIQRKDIEKHGATPGCPGCRAAVSGQKAVNHTEACRNRIEESMKGTVKGTKRLNEATTRANDFCAKAIKQSADRKEQLAQASHGGAALSGSPTPPPRQDPAPSTSSLSTPRPGSAEKRKRSPEDHDGDRAGHHETERATGSGSSADMDIMPMNCEEHVDLGEDEIHDQYFMPIATDDVTGKPLDAKMVRAAREDEMAELERLRVYDVVDLEECWHLTGRPPITAKWIDTNKGDDLKPKYRSRFVARQIRQLHGGSSREDVFAATPPWEAVKLLLSETVTNYDPSSKNKLMFIDISKAYLFAPVTSEDIFVDLPPEQAEPGKCGRLKKALYGTRDAARAWEMEYNRTLVKLGFVAGKSSTCVFYHAEKDMRLVVHGDDFVLSGKERHLNWFADELKNMYLVKIRGVLGPEKHDQKTIILLNRVMEWTDDGIQVEADPRHVELILADLGLQCAKGSRVTGSKIEVDAEPTSLSQIETTRYRSLVARGNYLASDRPDIQYAVKELCRDMCAPTHASWAKLKRLGRYLRDQPRLIIKYVYQKAPSHLSVYSDTDYAGCRRTRKSTSGGCAMFGAHCVKTWSSTQSIVALSSGEAEYYGLVKAGCSAIGLRALCVDLNIAVAVKLLTDSTAARGICNRRGVGKVRHMDVQLLWLQEKVQNGELRLHKVSGHENAADLMTKYVDAATILRLSNIMNATFAVGRSDAAPQLQGQAMMQ